MIFNSWTFLVFFLVVLVGYYLLGRRGPQNLFLLAASYVFYGAWNWRFLFLIFASTAVDFFVSRRLPLQTNQRRRRLLLLVSIGVNLGILGFFKYFNFFTESAVAALTTLGLDPHPPVLEVVLPVGISFYTFQTMSYTIDVFRGEMKPVRRFTDYALYIAFFPQLVAGPIERASRMIPQFQSERRTSSEQIAEGSWLILMGLFKKVVVADNLATIVNSFFSDIPGAPGGAGLLAVYAFAFQIYCDFSGYSDLARGTAKLLGFELRLNFNLPYLSETPKEFWTRWHISLSTWLRDYLYIPLGGNRRGRFGTYGNLMLTMLLGGLWHGAAWHFILWGGYHGLLLAGHRALTKNRGRQEAAGGQLGRILRILVMFNLTCVGWILFRVESLADLPALFANIASPWTISTAIAKNLFLFLFTVTPLLLLEGWIQNVDNPRGRPLWQPIGGAIAVGVMLCMLSVFASPEGQSFIYFQF